jgi:hypothetical protein
VCRPAVSDQEEQLLLEALLASSGGGGEDVEQGGGGGKKRQHSWFALVGIAAKYMWPDSLPLQVRHGAGGGGRLELGCPACLPACLHCLSGHLPSNAFMVCVLFWL